MALSRLTIDLGVGLAGFESDMGRAAKIVQKELKTMERDAERFAKRAGAVIGAGVVTGFALATRAATEFGAAMAEVSTLLDDTSSLDSMTESVKSLSKEFGKAPTEQAEALYQIISSGAKAGSQAIGVLTASNKLAIGGVTDLKTAADGLTSVLNAYGTEAGNVADVSDKFFAAMKAGKTTVGDLAGSIGPVINIAKELGVSFDELIAAASTLTLSGTTTSQAFNSLKAALANVVKPSKDAQETAAQLGLDFNAAALESKGLAGFLAEVQQAAGGNTEAITKLFGSVEGLNAVLALTGSSAGTFASTLESVQNAAGETEKAVAKMQETADQAFKRLSASLKVELIEIGAEVLDKLVPAIKLITDNIGALSEAMKALGIAIAAFTAVRLAAMTAGFIVAAQAVGTLRVAMAALGGPINAVALAFAALVTVAVKVAGPLREFLDGTTQLRAVTGDMKTSIEGVTSAWIAQAEALDLINERDRIRQQVIAADIELMKVQERLANKSTFGGRTLAEEAALGWSDAVGQLENLTTAADAAQQAIDDGTAAIVAINKQLKGLETGAGKAADVTEDLAEATGELNDELDEARRAYADMKAQTAFAMRLKEINRLVDEGSDLLADLVREQENYERSLQGILDQYNPLQAEGRRVGEMLAVLNQALSEGRINGEEFNRIVRQITTDLDEFATGLKQSADGVDVMTVAIDEGARIMADIFQEMFEGIIKDSSDAWDAILDGFGKMVAAMNREGLSDVVKDFQDAFKPGGGGFGAVDWKQAGLQFGAMASTAFADDIITGLFGGDEFGIDYAEIGKQIGALVGGVVGSFIPVIGTALGTIIGSFAGAIGGLLFGKLFGRKFGAILGGENIAGLEGVAPDAQVLRTALADVIGISGQGGFGNLNDPDTPGGEIGQAIQAFDQAIFDILKAANAGPEFEAIVTALENWKGAVDGGASTLEELLRGRFRAILGTMGQHVSDFVGLAEDLEDQIERFAVALSVDKLFEAAPEALAGRTQAEFLAVVEAYRDGLETIGEAAQEVFELFQKIVGLSTFLSDFTGSDPLTDALDFLEAQSRTVGQALDRVNGKLMDAVANYDGSIESLEEIAGLVATIREGELRYLVQLDALQKGLNANLDQLRADIIGINAPDKTGEQLFNEAQDLIRQVRSATSAEDIAALEREFDSLIRAITPEDQAFMQAELVGIIDLFRASANEALNAERQRVLDNAEAMRELVDVFQNDIGDALSIIAASNQRAADALSMIAAGETPAIPEALGPTSDVANQIIVANSDLIDQQNVIMQEGLSEIDSTVATIGPLVAQALQNGLAGIQINVVVQDQALGNL